jgi:hypothetical protein
MLRELARDTLKYIFSGFLGCFFVFFWVGFLLPTCPKEEEKEAEDGRRVRAVRQRVVTAPRPSSSPPALEATQQVAPA